MARVPGVADPWPRAQDNKICCMMALFLIEFVRPWKTCFQLLVFRLFKVDIPVTKDKSILLQSLLVWSAKEFLIRHSIKLNYCSAFKPPQSVLRERCRNVLQKLFEGAKLIQCGDLFLENTSFGDGKFCTNSHDNITLIVSAIAARDKFRDENLAATNKRLDTPEFW